MYMYIPAASLAVVLVKGSIFYTLRVRQMQNTALCKKHGLFQFLGFSHFLHSKRK